MSHTWSNDLVSIRVYDATQHEYRNLVFASLDFNDGVFDDSRISESSVTQHEGAITHDNLDGVDPNEHIDWTSTTENFSTTGSIAGGSGSLSGPLDFDEIAIPSAPGANVARMFAADDRGTTVIDYITTAGDVFRVGEDIFRICRNATGVTINQGQLVYFSGSTGNAPEIALAKADDITTMPCIGVARKDIANSDFGIVQVVGSFNSTDTSAFSEGDLLYVSPTTAGAFTNVQPVHPNFLQSVGTVEVSGVGNGKVLMNIAPFMSGQESGTRRNNFTIGDQTAGAITLSFDNGSILTLSANPSAARTTTIPDATGTVVLEDNTATLTNKTFDANATGNSLSNVEVEDLASTAKTGADSRVVTGTAGTAGNLSQWNGDGDAVDAAIATSDVSNLVTNITVTQAVDLDAIESRVNELDQAVVLQGTFQPSLGSFPGGGSAQSGESWIASDSGTIDGVEINKNDRLIAITDNASTSTYASNWHLADYTDEVLSVAGKTGAVTLTASDIASGTFADARISESSVTQHEGALTITESQISDLNHVVNVVSNVATSRILGRVTAGSGNSEELSPTQVRTLINVEDGATADQTAGEIESIVNHDNLLGFVANEHINWTNASSNFSTSGSITASSVNGFDVSPGSDTDADLITVDVTGSPTFSWDESADAFSFDKGVNITSGNVGVGTTDPLAIDGGAATKFHVDNGTGTGDIEVARFEGGSDADNTYGVLRVGHSNDRGFFVKGGREVGNTEHAVLGTTDNKGVMTDVISLLNSNVLPGTTESQDLGQADLEWDNLFVQNSPTVSDERRKNDLGPLDDQWIKFFDSLTAHLFTFKDRVIKDAVPEITEERQKTKTVKEEQTRIEVIDGVPTQKTKTVEVEDPVYDYVQVVDESGNPVYDQEGEPLTHPVPVMETVTIPGEDKVTVTHGRPHTGFFAQAVKQAMTDAGIEDWAGYAYDEDADLHMLRLQEFIAPLLYYVQVKTQS